MNSRIIAAAALWLAAFILRAAPSFASDLLTPQGYLQYYPVFNDTYNGVTTGDGEDLSGSFSVKAKIFYRRFAAEYQYYRDLTNSDLNATLPSGAPGTILYYPTGQVIVPPLTASDSASEYRLEYQPLRLPVYFGLAYSASFNNYNFPTLTAVGIGVELQPNLNRIISPYGSYFFFPNQTGTYPLSNPNDPTSGSAHSAFFANELELGAAVTYPKINVSLLLGYYQNTNVHKYSNVHSMGNYNFVRDGPYVGLGYRIR